MESNTTDVEVCRICLALDCKLFPMTMNQLEQAYESLTGIQIIKDHLPKHVCSECAQRLLNSYKFRRKCLNTNLLLNRLASTDDSLTLNSIKSIDRDSHYLKSSLSQGSIQIEDNIRRCQTPTASTELFSNFIEIKIEPNDTILNETEVFKQELDDKKVSLDMLKSETDTKQLSVIPEENCVGNNDCLDGHYAEGITSSGALFSKTPVLDQKYKLDESLKKFREKLKKLHNFSHSELHTKNVKLPAGAKPFSCDVCGRPFTLKCNLRQHVRIHTGEKPYTCEVCGKGFTQNSQLFRHVKIHSGVKPFSCDVCAKKFTLKSTLHQHAKIHTGERNFSCDVCEKKFTLKCNLQQHVRTHTGEKPYQCEVCEKRFAQKVVLSKHLSIHTGEKNYGCEVCGKKFSRKNEMIQHMRIHTGERLYTCDICGKSFRTTRQLHEHVKIHTGDKKYSCDVCGKKCIRRRELLKHMNVHKSDKT